jgi:hypothetical protein
MRISVDQVDDRIGLGRKLICFSNLSQAEDFLCEWFSQERGEIVPISERLLEAWAVNFRKQNQREL